MLLAELFADAGLKRTLVFTRTKRGADRVAKHLVQSGISSAESIHGDKSQGQRERAAQGVQGRPGPRPRRHRHRRARHRHRRREPRHQLRAAQRAGGLCAPHRPHGARRRLGHRHQPRRQRRAAAAARHPETHPSDGDGPGSPRRSPYWARNLRWSGRSRQKTTRQPKPQGAGGGGQEIRGRRTRWAGAPGGGSRDQGCAPSGLAPRSRRGPRPRRGPRSQRVPRSRCRAWRAGLVAKRAAAEQRRRSAAQAPQVL